MLGLSIMTSPDIPRFDISQVVEESVHNRLQAQGVTLYSRVVMGRMVRNNHPSLASYVTEITNPQTVTKEQTVGRMFGACVGYDLITLQLEKDTKSFKVDEVDIYQYFEDRATQGRGINLRESGLVKLNELEERYKEERGSFRDATVRWFINLMNLHSPILFRNEYARMNIMRSVSTTSGVAFVEGFEVPAMIFYRKLGFIGQTT